MRNVYGFAYRHLYLASFEFMIYNIALYSNESNRTTLHFHFQCLEDFLEVDTRMVDMAGMEAVIMDMEVKEVTMDMEEVKEVMVVITVTTMAAITVITVITITVITMAAGMADTTQEAIN